MNEDEFERCWMMMMRRSMSGGSVNLSLAGEKKS